MTLPCHTNMDAPLVRREWTPGNGILAAILALSFAAGEVGGFCQLKSIVSSKYIKSSTRERGESALWIPCVHS